MDGNKDDILVSKMTDLLNRGVSLDDLEIKFTEIFKDALIEKNSPDVVKLFVGLVAMTTALDFLKVEAKKAGIKELKLGNDEVDKEIMEIIIRGL